MTETLVPEETMKPWQHGYPLQVLKTHEKFYDDYNTFALSPFLKVKKNNIAEWLHEGSLVFGKNYSFRQETVKVRTKIYSYGNVLIGTKEKGDVVLSCLAGDAEGNEEESIYKALTVYRYRNGNCWLYVWAEDERWCQFARRSGFKYIHGKISTFGDVISIYFRDSAASALFDRPFPKIDDAEKINVTQIASVPDPAMIEAIKMRLNEVGIQFANHYSNYNVKKSWSAITLRGYSPDPLFIAKPIEMNDKWKEEHKDETYFLQDTTIYEKFPEVKLLLSWLPPENIHRIRFMKLIPGGGELSRHTDQVDPDSGNSIGKLTRIHYPITSNKDVIFTSWTYQGHMVNVNMRPGEIWVLNTNYPHRVINGGTEDRIHLVIDAIVDENLHGVIMGKWKNAD